MHPTLKELGVLYQANLKFFDKAPAPATAYCYASILVRVGELAGISQLSELTPDTIQKAKLKYLKNAEKHGRNRDSAAVTLAGIIRNAAAVFSRQSLEIFRQQGLEITNPFSGVKVRGVQMKTYSPMSRELVSSSWSKAHLLRDGDTDAGPPSLDDRSGTDFRDPQPAVYLALILELGLGLRRSEADKARWDWISQTTDGRRFLEVREGGDFRTKSRQSRVIPMAEEIWQVLEPQQKKGEVYIMPGPEAAKPSKTPRRIYRCLPSHEALVFWLKKQGVTDSKPCHALRKEFGSYVATCFSLFHAQKLLGHSTPAVTSAHYASLTDLPDLNHSTMGQSKS